MMASLASRVRMLLPTLVAGAVVASAPLAAQDGDDVRAMFEAYRQQRYDDVRRQLSAVQDFGDLRTSIDRDGSAWPAEPKLAFMLEAARAALEADAGFDPDGPGARLFRDACAQVRRLRADGAFEMAWNAAALALLDGPYGAVIGRREHLGHIGRVDPALRALSDARSAERAAWQYASHVRGGPLDEDEGGDASSGAKVVATAIERLTAAAGEPGAVAEATLRRGALRVAAGHVADGLADLAAVGALTDDPALEYLALFLAGRTLSAMGRQGEARQLYEAALIRWPAGRSAALGLAALDFGANRRADASALAREALAIPAEAADPWFGFHDGQWPHLESRIVAMRGALR